jgi:hypothetical protein
MQPLSYYLSSGVLYLIALAVLVLVFKAILYFKYEKQWDPIGFFYYSRIGLKMTTSKNLKAARKRQNILTLVIVVLGCLVITLSLFNKLIGL